MSVDRATIESQLRSLGPESNRISDSDRDRIRKEMEEGETIRTSFYGSYDDSAWQIVVTDRRFFFLELVFIFSRQKRMEWPLSSISALSFRLHDQNSGDIELSMGGVPRLLENIPGKKSVPKIHEIITQTINEYQCSRSKDSTGPEHLISQLERLAKLKHQGILTEEEFMQQKARLLGL